MTTPTSKPFGRSLSDFGELLPAEKQLRDAVRLGEPAVFGEERPSECTPNNEIRAGFLRFIALGGDEQVPVHERGVQVAGAWVSGALNVAACDISGNFGVCNSHFVNLPVFHDTHFHGALNLSGSQLPGLYADRITVDGSFFLRSGFFSTGEVRLLGGHIGGNFQCSEGRFNNADGNALSADGAVIEGDTFLDEGFHAEGEVRLLGVRIGGNLSCTKGSLNTPKGNALYADGADIQGDVFLNDGFQAQGKVLLLGVNIRGNLYCDGGNFCNEEGDAFVAENMSVTGSFVIHSLNKPLIGINLAGAEVDTLIDDVQNLEGDLVLDGFIYQRLSGKAPCDAATRITWLKKQRHDHCYTSNNFKPHPWKQLIRTLRKMGHEEEARQVAIAYETHRRQHKIIRNPISRAFHWLFGLFIAYGYRPLRLFFIMMVIWLCCAGMYWTAALHDVFAPGNPLVFNHPNYQHCSPGYQPTNTGDKAKFGNWYLCPELAGEYTGFSPLAYSLDLILPLVDLQQEHDWAPYIPTPKATWHEELWQFFHPEDWKYHWTRLLVWFEILFGWVASLLLVAVVSGLTNRDKEE